MYDMRDFDDDFIDGNSDGIFSPECRFDVRKINRTNIISNYKHIRKGAMWIRGIYKNIREYLPHEDRINLCTAQKFPICYKKPPVFKYGRLNKWYVLWRLNNIPIMIYKHKQQYIVSYVFALMPLTEPITQFMLGTNMEDSLIINRLSTAMTGYSNRSVVKQFTGGSALPARRLF
jgi:hypothetical protein